MQRCGSNLSTSFHSKWQERRGQFQIELFLLFQTKILYAVEINVKLKMLIKYYMNHSSHTFTTDQVHLCAPGPTSSALSRRRTAELISVGARKRTDGSILLNGRQTMRWRNLHTTPQRKLLARVSWQLNQSSYEPLNLEKGSSVAILRPLTWGFNP